MAQMKYSAGDFEVEAWSDGHPMWVTIKHRGQEFAPHIHHDEIKDLQYVLERLNAAMKREQPSSASELD